MNTSPTIIRIREFNFNQQQQPELAMDALAQLANIEAEIRPRRACNHNNHVAARMALRIRRMERAHARQVSVYKRQLKRANVRFAVRKRDLAVIDSHVGSGGRARRTGVRGKGNYARWTSTAMLRGSSLGSSLR